MGDFGENGTIDVFGDFSPNISIEFPVPNYPGSPYKAQNKTYIQFIYSPTNTILSK